MFVSKIFDGETPEALSARLGCPLCMLLRANGLLSTAWLWPGREIRVPAAGECRCDDTPCPVRFARAEAYAAEGFLMRTGDRPERIAALKGIPERIVLAAQRRLRPGAGMYLPVREAGVCIRTVMPGQTWRDFKNADSLMVLNGLFSPLYPGMKILAYGEETDTI